MAVAPLRFLLLLFAGWANRHQLEVIDHLKEENRIVREQLGGRRFRFTVDQRRRLATKGKALGRRALIARKYDGSARRGVGRPASMRIVQQLVVRFASENPSWGYTRIRGALSNLGHELGRNTIKRILKEHELEPAPSRGTRLPWKTFLKAHLGAVAAMDFFSVEVLTLAGLIRYQVLFVIDIATRRVGIAGIAREPDSAWMKQVARNLTDSVDGFLQ